MCGAILASCGVVAQLCVGLRDRRCKVGRVQVIPLFVMKKAMRNLHLRRLIIGVILGTVGLAVYNLVAMLAERYEERHTPRIDGSVFAVGSEVLDLGDRDAAGAVLMVHGFIGGSDNFGPLPERLAEQGLRVRAMRLPGHGTTPRDFAAQTPESLLAGVMKELQDLKAEHQQVYLVGHSMGGALVAQAASMEDVSGAVLVAPAFGVAHQWFYGLKAETWTQILAPIVPWVYKGDLFKQVNLKESKSQIYSYRWVPTKGLLCLQNVSAKAKSDETLINVKCPLLLIHSRGDVAAAYEHSEQAFAKVAAEDKRMVTLDRSNHHVFWDFEREQVYAEIEAFIEVNR